MSEPIHNIELEQALLGCLLVNNDNFHKISAITLPDHFFDPVHMDIYKKIVGRIAKEHLASPVTLKTDLEAHPGLAELGGPAYLARLAGAAMSVFAVKDFALNLLEIFNRRRLSEVTGAGLVALENGANYSDVKSGFELFMSEVPDEENRESSMSMLKAFTGAIEQMGEGYKQGIPQGIMTGLTALDDKTSGLHKPDFIIIGGRPGMGKTSIATSIGLRVARQNIPVGIVSLEMDDTGLAHRVLSELSGVPYFTYRNSHKMREQDFRATIEAAQEAESLPMEIVPPHVRDTGAIYSALKRIDRKYADRGGLGLVIVDYLQLIRARGNGRTEQMTEVSQQLKHMAKMLNCPVIALSQLSRGVENRDNKRPMLSDLRESGQIEQDADAVLFCYRDFYYLDRETPPKKVEDQADWEAAKTASKKVMEVNVAKQRMGPIGTITIGCDMPTNRFWDLEETKQIGMDMEF
jgi:replicative DNA helicase